MIPTKLQIKTFEDMLDSCLARRPMFGFDANEALLLAGNIVESAFGYDSDGAMYSVLSHGIHPYASHLVSGREGTSPDIEQMAEDLLFGARYWSLREFIYYSYNAPGTIDWTIADDHIELRYADRSLPRQFFTVFNEWLMGSSAHFGGRDAIDLIKGMLKGVPEWELTEVHEKVAPLLAEETEHKLAAYFSILAGDSDITLGGYTYREFMKVYRSLLVKALYHRYHGLANETVGCVFFTPSNIISDAALDSGLEPATIAAILRDLVYDEDAARQNVDSTYFVLHQQGAAPGYIVMQPAGFSLAEGLVKLLRVVAKRRPGAFLSKVSNALGSAFVTRAARAFEAQGFSCRTEVSLRRIDPTLPDIDLLVISEEPTLGFVLFVCEVKSPLPPLWAKDQLRALEPTGISKAFRQADAIRGFLGTSDGISFLRTLLPERGIEHFDGFVVVINQLIITSDNGGMFFEAEEVPVISFRTMERMLARCDGDVTYLQSYFRGHKEALDGCYHTPMTVLTLDGITVEYESVSVRKLLDFPEHKWRSDGTRERVTADFVADGHHPFDCLEGRASVKVAGINAFLLSDDP